MAHPYHHALSSVRNWGGTAQEYLPVHTWFDESKSIIADFRHRALRHHAQGIVEAERVFAPTLILSTGRVVPVRWIGEQHVREDLGRIPSFADWVRAIRPEAWMGRATTLGVEDAPRGDPPWGATSAGMSARGRGRVVSMGRSAPSITCGRVSLGCRPPAGEGILPSR